MKVELKIFNKENIYVPVVKDTITLTSERQGAPSQLSFGVIKDDALNFTEGNLVTLTVEEKGVFKGYVFTKKRNKDTTITVTAYDQLRYFKNKDTYIYENKTAGELIQMLASDFNLKTGVIENTGYKIVSRVEDNTTLMDMVQASLELTLQNTGKMYVLYDDFGALTLKSLEAMYVNLLLDEEMGEDYSYGSSIDSNTYNKIKLTYEDEDEGKRAPYEESDPENMKRWGVLQHHETIKGQENGQIKARALLKLYNKKTRTLSISKVFGDTRIRAGSMLAVQLNLGDVELSNVMLVEKCKHIFENTRHYMDLTLRGGEFIA